jgi:hypothetical protein
VAARPLAREGRPEVGRRGGARRRKESVRSVSFPDTVHVDRSLAGFRQVLGRSPAREPFVALAIFDVEAPGEMPAPPLAAAPSAEPAVAAATPAKTAAFRQIAHPHFETFGLAREDQFDRGARHAFALTVDGAGSLKQCSTNCRGCQRGGARCRSPVDEQRDRVALRAAMKKAAGQ